METIGDRLFAYIAYLGVSVRNFEGTCGFANGYVKNVKSIGSDKLISMHEAYPNLSINWLLFGEGEMLITDAEKHVNDTPTTRKRHDNEPERLPDNSGEVEALRETIATQRITIQSLLEQIDLLKKGDSSAQRHSARVG